MQTVHTHLKKIATYIKLLCDLEMVLLGLWGKINICAIHTGIKTVFWGHIHKEMYHILYHTSVPKGLVQAKYCV